MNLDLGSFCIALLLFVGLGNGLGQLFARLGQPRICGEIWAGIALGAAVAGSFVPALGPVLGSTTGAERQLLELLADAGLVLLMFVSGAEARGILASENRRPTTWLLACGTAMPFALGLACASMLPMEEIAGPTGGRASLALVFAIAVSVTSIPVLSHIFHSLGIIHTRFASLILGIAVLEDLALWSVLALATAVSGTAVGDGLASMTSLRVGATVLYMTAGLAIMPSILRRLSRAKWNALAQRFPVAWMAAVLLAFVGGAAALDVNAVFAAFLAGYGIIGGMRATEQDRFKQSVASAARIGFATLIPVYTVMIGYRLDLTNEFFFGMVFAFLIGSSAIQLVSVGFASYCAGFRGLDVVNIAVTSNARGGPGIVLASVAFEAGIINAPFFTSLVLTAVLTSQFAGWWLGFVIRNDWPLLKNSDLNRGALHFDLAHDSTPIRQAITGKTR